MRGHFTKVAVLFLVLAIALAGIGVGFAHWSKTLTIDGTVNTGMLDVVWSADASWDTEPPEKDASSISCWVDYSADPTGETLAVVLDNAYPSIDYYQLVNLENIGTIPVHINSINFDVPLCEPDGAPSLTVEMLPFDPSTGLPFELAIVSSTQLHGGDTAWGVIHVHVEQCAQQDSTIYFTGTVNVIQWNVAQ